MQISAVNIFSVFTCLLYTSISKVQPNSMAAQRGLKSGDIIIGINRQPIESTQDLRKALDEKPSAVALNILRGKNNFYLLVQ